MGTRKLIGLDLKDVDMVSGGARVLGKGRKTRTVFMGQKCRKALRAYLKVRGDEPGPLYLNTHGAEGGINYHGIRSMLRRACNVAGIDLVPIHSFRRGYALNMLRNGVDVYSLQRLMGHADLQVLRRYLNQNDEDLQLAQRRASPLDNSSL